VDIVARLMGAVKDVDSTVAREAASEILLLRHQLRQMQGYEDDALRYRWLRSQYITISEVTSGWIATGYGLDQTCDQGMKDDG
jgi:hypothetical protein